MKVKVKNWDKIKPRVHRVGAPPGLRAHWLLSELVLVGGGTFTKEYHLNYNFDLDNYRFSRYNKRTLVDEFIVIRSSKRCYRVMYYNADYEHFIYFSAENYRECAARMVKIYQIFKQLEFSYDKEKAAEIGGSAEFLTEKI